MDRDLNQANNVSRERSRRKPNAHENNGALIIKIHRRYFKKTVLRLTRCPPNRRLDMFPPPPLNVDRRRPSAVPITTLPYRFPAVPIITTAVITSTVESLSTLPPSPPSSPSLPLPLSPREQESGEAWVAAILQDFENSMMENDTNQEQLSGLWSPLPPLVANGDEYQQQESIPPPPVPVWSDSPNDQGSEYIPPPPVPASAPFGSLEWLMSPNNPWENIPPPPVPASAPFGSTDRPSSLNDLISEDIPPPLVPATSPYGSLYWQWPDSPSTLSELAVASNSTSFGDFTVVECRHAQSSQHSTTSSGDFTVKESRLAQFSERLAMGEHLTTNYGDFTVRESRLAQSSERSTTGERSTIGYGDFTVNESRLAQSSERSTTGERSPGPLVPATSPLGNLEWLYSPNNVPSPTFLSPPTFLPSPTTGLLPNLN